MTEGGKDGNALQIHSRLLQKKEADITLSLMSSRDSKRKKKINGSTRDLV